MGKNGRAAHIILEDLPAMFFEHIKGFIADVMFDLAGIGSGRFFADAQVSENFNQRIMTVKDGLGDLLSRREQRNVSGRVPFNISVFLQLLHSHTDAGF